MHIHLVLKASPKSSTATNSYIVNRNNIVLDSRFTISKVTCQINAHNIENSIYFNVLSCFQEKNYPAPHGQSIFMILVLFER